VTAAYIQEQGSRVERAGECLVVRKDGRTLAEIPLAGLEQLSVFGNVQLTTPALQLLCEHGVDAFLLTRDGSYRGHLHGMSPPSLTVKRSQFELAARPLAVLELARRFVQGKIANQVAVCARRRRRGTADVTELLRRHGRRAGRATDLEALRGIEGMAAKTYFEAWPAHLIPGLPFTQRTRRPPTDLVNALLSLGYTLLAGELTAVLHRAGLEPYLGFLHAPRPGHAALASDLMEEFRAPVVDLLVINLLNRREIRPDDTVPHGVGVHLNDEARRLFFAAYRTRLNAPVRDPRRQVQSTYRGIISAQVAHLGQLLTQGSTEYVAFRLRE
jgi:CRISPR-associated protein Cas1